MKGFALIKRATMLLRFSQWRTRKCNFLTKVNSFGAQCIDFFRTFIPSFKYLRNCCCFIRSRPPGVYFSVYYCKRNANIIKIVRGTRVKSLPYSSFIPSFSIYGSVLPLMGFIWLCSYFVLDLVIYPSSLCTRNNWVC